MRRAVRLLVVLLLLCVCAGGNTFAQETAPLQIVTTIFPEYDWVREILGENPNGAEVTLLLDSGVDLHNYQPTAPDILKVSACDVFVYVGGESDAWVEDALQEAVNPDLRVVNLLDVLGDAVVEEERVEGMEDDAKQEPGADAAEESGADEEAEYDEHVWLSLRNAAVLTDALAQVLGEADPEHAALYRANADAYTERLAALDEAYANAVEAAGRRTLLFGDRFPFRYLTEDYGLDYYAAFAGCSAETEASFETIAFLAGKVDELDLDHVMVIEGTDHRIAETIIRTTASKDQTILTLDSMQATTGQDAENGVTYLSVMEQNLAVLQEALE